MSWLEMNGMGGFFESAASGWGPFNFLTKKEERKEKKDLAKIQLQSEAASFEQKRLLAMDEARSDALEGQRRKTVAKLRELEAEAVATTGLVMKIRELSGDPALEGDRILFDLEEELLDIEKAVVGVQASTVVDTATFDTYDLAEAYSNGQAALVAMRTITARANGIMRSLEERIIEIEEERGRRMEAARREEQFRRDDIRRQQQAEQERARQQRMDLIRQVMNVDAELAKEKRALRRARMELANLKAAQEERAARRRDMAIRMASIAKTRAG
jgi:hypothetical protein